MAALALGAGLIGAATLGAQDAIETLPVKGQVSMVAGAGGNVTVLDGPQGVLLVDAGRQGMSDALLAGVRRITTRPIHFLLNTTGDMDHVGGNLEVGKAGRPAPGSNQAASPNTPIYAHENVLNRMSLGKGGDPMLEIGYWPTVTFFTAKRTLYFNNEPIELIWQKAAHTDGDLLIFFRLSDVVSAGDVLNTTSFPVIDLTHGGSIQGEIDALNRIIDITVPRLNQMDGTRVIPGHGRICNEADVVEYRDMVTIIRDRVKTLADQGKSLEDVVAARPAYEYEPLYGTDKAWTTRQFVEAVYRSLKPAERTSRQ